MKKTFTLGLLLSCGLAFSQVQNENEKTENPPAPIPVVQKVYSSEDTPQHFKTLISQITEGIDPLKVNGSGILNSTIQFSVDEKQNIEKGSFSVSGDNESFNQEVERVVKPLLSQWKPEQKADTPNPTKHSYSFPITLAFK
ncbi:hypothetical protein [Chryseobacterium sp. CT-SW4]|uniref:hypothetical protein n=1 Tax=Chryseobacterium sp. SW-1 TaxID=3157343 RepID=UPI003B0147B3